MTIDQRLLEASKLAAERTGLPERFLAAWFVSENGWNCPDNFNFGNISYQGEGVPSGGVFEGVERVETNKVCVYKDMAAGINAFVLLLETPKHDKALTVDLSDLHACGEDVHRMCEVVGESNWASSHYDSNGQGAGSLIWNVYNSPAMVDSFKEMPAAATAPVTEHTTHPAVKPSHHADYVIRKGDALSRIALHVRIPMHAIQVLNGIEDADKIEAGETLKIPNVYTVRPGDVVSRIAEDKGTTVEEIAKMNLINPDRIDVGQVLYY